MRLLTSSPTILNHGHRPGRMDDFARDLLAVFATHASQTFAWCVLPNHYHP